MSAPEHERPGAGQAADGQIAGEQAAGESKGGLKRGLKRRHIQMIALGSSIGTGLFLASGATVQMAGPIVLLGYMVAGAIIFLVMRMLGEMAVKHPIAGSFSAYATRYVGRIAGFLSGWNWWYTCIVVSMLELAAAGVYMDFWFPGHPHWLTALIAFLAITAVNLIHVGVFGEFEFWFNIIKVAAVIGMIVLGAALIFGLGPGEPIGFENLWEHGGIAPYGIGGFMLSLVAVTFTFGGIVSIGTAAGETDEPKKSIPKAINTVLLRILVFYVGAIGVMLILWPWNEIGIEESPFVLILANLGLGGAAIILNIVVLTAVLSVYNNMVFSGARMLRGLAEKGDAPRYFRKVNARGVPVRALFVNAGITAAAMALNYLFADQVILLLVSVILGAEMISWSTIVISHLRFRRELNARGERPEFRTPGYPVANFVCLAFFLMLYAMMWMLPDYRVGAIALPIWIAILLVAGSLNIRYQKRKSPTGVIPQIELETE